MDKGTRLLSGLLFCGFESCWVYSKTGAVRALLPSMGCSDRYDFDDAAFLEVERLRCERTKKLTEMAKKLRKLGFNSCWAGEFDVHLSLEDAYAIFIQLLREEERTRNYRCREDEEG